jgi:hypothetical protein
MTHHKKPELARRMARIEGHIRGIRKMIEDDKGYPDTASFSCSCCIRWRDTGYN